MEKFIERHEYNNIITIKIVIPAGCNAKCPFCYNKDKEMNYDTEKFLKNFLPSLKDIVNKIGNKNPMSLDITGGEPTLNIPLIINVINQLKESGIKEKFCRVTLTTNGVHLKEVAPYFKDFIDYINISIHDYNIDKRKEIMGFIIEDYKDIIKECNKAGITCSATGVLFRHIDNFPIWRDNFIKWAKEQGFIAVRFRYCNDTVLHNDEFDEYLLASVKDDKFQVITHEQTPDSHWCRLRMEDKFRVFFLHGVLDTSLYSKGIEYVIDDDGHCYCDYYKRTPIEKYEYEIGKIYDKVEEN